VARIESFYFLKNKAPRITWEIGNKKNWIGLGGGGWNCEREKTLFPFLRFRSISFSVLGGFFTLPIFRGFGIYVILYLFFWILEQCLFRTLSKSVSACMIKRWKKKHIQR
jgi:hypothetical protein